MGVSRRWYLCVCVPSFAITHLYMYIHTRTLYIGKLRHLSRMHAVHVRVCYGLESHLGQLVFLPRVIMYMYIVCTIHIHLYIVYVEVAKQQVYCECYIHS